MLHDVDETKEIMDSVYKHGCYTCKKECKYQI